MEHKALRGGRQGADRLGDPLVGSQCIELLGAFRTVLAFLIQAAFVKSKSSRSASFGGGTSVLGEGKHDCISVRSKRQYS